MTEHTAADGADALTRTDDLVESEFMLNGETYPMTVRDVTESELDDLEDVGADADMTELEEKRYLIDEYLVKPDIDAEAIENPRKVNVLFMSMLATWGGKGDIAEAFGQMELGEVGNR